VRRYGREYCLVKEYRPVSQYGLFCRDKEGATHSCILLVGGGASRVHDHSAIIVNGSCFVGVGDMLCCLSLPTLNLKWAIKVDRQRASEFIIFLKTIAWCLTANWKLPE
jgi:hypothetical protein